MINVEIKLDPKLSARLAALADDIRHRILAKALKAGGMVLVEAARNRAPRDTGTLRRAIACWVRQEVGEPPELVVGTIRAVTAFIPLPPKRVRVDGQLDGRSRNRKRHGIRRTPWYYARLVEKGTKNASAHPFIGPARAAALPRAMAIIRDRIRFELAERKTR